MNFKEYIDGMNTYLKKNPDAGKYTVVTSIDDEGNGFNEVLINTPTAGNFDGMEFQFENDINEMVADDPEYYEEYPIELDAICIN